MRRLSAAAAAVFLALSAVPCTAPAAPADKESTRYMSSMDTLITITAWGEGAEKALDAAEAEIIRLNDLLSIGLEDSEISRLNAAGEAVLSADSRALVEESLALYESTEGAFDITVYPLMELWGFTSGDYRVPSDEEIAEVLETVDAGRLTFDSETGTLVMDEGQTVDLGGIAKGYASARIMDIFRENGLTSGLVSLGGNVQCLGSKPDGSPYRLGIRDPFGGDGLALIITAEDCAVITSGGYERFFVDEESGHTYQHIMDPKTGRPAESDLASVSIVTKNGMLGDGLSTSLYIMGLEKSIEYWRAHADEFDFILIGTDGKIYISDGLSGRIASDTKVQVIVR